MIDVKKLRKQFPVLRNTMRGRRLVYFDNAATTLKPKTVLEAESDYYRSIGANIHRGVYELSEKATFLFDEAREKAARFINAPDPSCIIFTRGTTDSINLVSRSWGAKGLRPGSEILTTELEHHSNLVPWQHAAEEAGARLRFIPVDPGTGSLLLDDPDSLFTEHTALLTLTGMSNVNGYMPPLKMLIDAAHARKVPVLVDGAQLVSHHPVDLAELDVDFLAFSSHKLCGPTGLGVLYGKRSLLEAMDPYLYGGDMIRRVWKDGAEYKGIPEKFEAGTPHIAGVIGFGRALDFLSEIGMAEIAAYENSLLRYAVERSAGLDFLELYPGGSLDRRGGIFSFNVRDVHSHDTGTVLDRQGVAVRAGFHCAQPYMRLLGISGTTRASFYFYNTKEEIDIFINSLEQVKDIFL
jgi:cysteine desulfurase/selenocysteine lyase